METPKEESAQAEWAAIKEDSQELIRELAHMLTEKGFKASVTVAQGCKAGTCGCKFLLLVLAKDSQAALQCLDEYYMELHPEMKETQEWMDQGKCPACGFDVGEKDKECSDCGLTLLFDA